jgi:hypothetical protein
VSPRELQPLGDEIDPDDQPRAAMARDATAHLADRTEAEDRELGVAEQRGALALLAPCERLRP